MSNNNLWFKTLLKYCTHKCHFIFNGRYGMRVVYVQHVVNEDYLLHGR